MYSIQTPTNSATVFIYHSASLSPLSSNACTHLIYGLSDGISSSLCYNSIHTHLARTMQYIELLDIKQQQPLHCLKHNFNIIYDKWVQVFVYTYICFSRRAHVSHQERAAPNISQFAWEGGICLYIRVYIWMGWAAWYYSHTHYVIGRLLYTRICCLCLQQRQDLYQFNSL